MKKVYLSLLCFSAFCSVNAQLTQSNNAPSPSYTYQTYQCDSTGILPGASGAGANWNFSSVVTHSSTLLSFVTATVSNATYPNAPIAVASSTSNTWYYSSSASSVYYYGGNLFISPVVGSINYTGTPAVIASYPMTLNTTSVAVVSGSAAITQPIPGSGPFTGTSTVLCDATGTITLPGTPSTYTDALRVVNSQTLLINLGFATGTVMQVVYNYYSPGTRAALFSISNNTVITGLGGPSTQTLVTRLKATPQPTSDVGFKQLTAEENQLIVYPNPSSSIVNFVTGDKTGSVSVFDMTGRLVEKLYIVEGRGKIDVSNFSKGLYIYKYSSATGTDLKSGKITVIQ